MTGIYHGTPMTPRDALLSVCAGRAMCISFYRPDDVEAVEAISPAIMFRQRRVLILASRTSAGRGMGRASRLAALLRVAGASPVSSGQMGDHPRYAGSAFPAQRCAPERLALWAEGRTPLAHGRTHRTAPAAVRAIRPRVLGMDRAEGRLAGLSRAHGRGGSGLGQSLASHSHDARNGGGLRLPVPQRGQHLTRTERVAV
jgi:hypothetical protein